MKEYLKLIKICEQDTKDVEDIKRRLNKIKKKKNDVDPDVYNKIFSEYNTKLENVNKNLNDNKIKLQEIEKGINQKLKNSEKKYSDLKKKVDEIELRYLAEEFDEDEYKEKFGTNTKELETLEDFILKAKKVLSGNKNVDTDTDTDKVDDIEGKVVEEEIPDIKEKISQPKEKEQEQEEPPLMTQTVSETPSEESINNFDVNLDQTIEDIFGGSLGNEEEAGVETKKEDKIEKVEEKPIPKEDSEASFENFFNESEVGDLIEELKDVTEKEQEIKEEKEEKEVESATATTGDEKSFIEHDTIITVDPNEKAEDKYIECPKCGYKNKPDSWFCEKCGVDLMQ
jgi:hypothetical protein